MFSQKQVVERFKVLLLFHIKVEKGLERRLVTINRAIRELSSFSQKKKKRTVQLI